MVGPTPPSTEVPVPASAPPPATVQLSAEEEAVKSNTDCVYFLASPLTCKKVWFFLFMIFQSSVDLSSELFEFDARGSVLQEIKIVFLIIFFG